jgi:hypothetical protein
MKYTQYKFTANVWLYSGKAGWHFVSLPTDISGDIKREFGDRSRGWGSLPVEVSLGLTTWTTSIFPDKKAGTYLLPLKAEVRKKEVFKEGDSLKFVLELKV